jgi:hypothetical protein
MGPCFRRGDGGIFDQLTIGSRLHGRQADPNAKVVHDSVNNLMRENAQPAHSAQIATRGDARKAAVSTQG